MFGGSYQLLIPSILIDNADSVYVIMTEDSPQKLFVWSGSSASSESVDAAKTQAQALGDSGDEVITVEFETQGAESGEFKTLFPSLQYVPTEDNGDEHEDGEGDAPAEGTGAAGAGAGKKKRRKKKKGGNGAAAATAAAATAVEEEALEETPAPPPPPPPPAAPEPESDERPPMKMAMPKPTAQEAAVVAELQEKLAVKEQEAAPAPAPPAAAPASPAPPKKTEEPPKQQSTPVTKPPAAASTESTPQKALTSPALPNVVTSNPTSFTPKATATRSYLADASKAWGGTAVTVTAGKVTVPPGSKFYTYDELKALRADSGIDMTSKEKYLNDDEFEKVFKKDRAAWLAQPAWRQQLQKKEVGLF